MISILRGRALAIAGSLLVAGVAPLERPADTQARAPKSLFNGKDLKGWHVDVPALDTNPRGRNPFIVRNGMLVSLGEPQGHIITDSSYRNYRLEVEYRFPGKPGNSGVLVHASTPRALYKMYFTSSMRDPKETAEQSACVRFARDFLPEVNKALAEVYSETPNSDANLSI